MKFYRYSSGDTLKISPILYNGEFFNSISFMIFYDNNGNILRFKSDSKWYEILISSFEDNNTKLHDFRFRGVSIRLHQPDDRGILKCLTSIESKGEKFFIVLPISIHHKLLNISKERTHYLYINDGDYKIVETDEIKDFNKIEESKHDIDNWLNEKNDKISDFFKNNYVEIYLKYIEKERESKLNYLLEK
jgi:hypothetical protein